jgi:hypothetical protein
MQTQPRRLRMRLAGCTGRAIDQGSPVARYELPIKMPARNTSAPPTMT